MIEYLVIVGVCIGIMYIIVKRAPFGYENKTGFHYGHPSKSDDEE